MYNNTPEYLISTVDMVRRAFPSGVPDIARRYALIELLRRGECSDRSIAQVLAATDGTNREAAVCLYEVQHVQPMEPLDDLALEQAGLALEANGYKEWLMEE